MARFSILLSVALSCCVGAQAQVSTVFAPRQQPPSGFTPLADSAFSVQCSPLAPASYPLDLTLSLAVPQDQELDTTYQQTGAMLSSATNSGAPAVPPGLFITVAGHPIWTINTISFVANGHLTVRGTLQYGPTMGPISECGAHLYVWGKLRAMPNAVRLRVSADAAKTLLASNLFPNNRMYLQGDKNSPCYVFLENPQLTLSNDHLVIQAHLSGKSGAVIGGTCLGPAESFNVTASGDTYASGSKIGMRNITVNAAKYEDIIKRKLNIGNTYEIDLADELRKAFTQPSVSALKPDLRELRILTFTVTPDAVTIAIAASAELGTTH